MSSVCHRLFTRSWRPINPYCILIFPVAKNHQCNTMGKAFSCSPCVSILSRDFDITLLIILLRNICGLAPPLTGWDALPVTTDVSREADIAQIKYFRNTVYGHAEQASVDDATFNKHWKEIRDTLVRLEGVTYEEKNSFFLSYSF